MPREIPRIAAVVSVIALGTLTIPLRGQQPPAPASESKNARVPRTSFNRPDLQGVWDFRAATPMERPKELAGKEFLTAEEAREFERRNAEAFDRDRRDGGAAADVARAYNDVWWDFGKQVIGTRRTSLVIVPLDGRPHMTDRIHQWAGDSRGRWEGDTLVVDTTNFRGTMLVRERGFDVVPGSHSFHLIERFTRTSPDTLVYQFTVDDPDTYSSPWTAEFPMTLNNQNMYEYACHEGNYGMEFLLNAARAEER